jgi:hypothetical protein
VRLFSTHLQGAPPGLTALWRAATASSSSSEHTPPTTHATPPPPFRRGPSLTGLRDDPDTPGPGRSGVNLVRPRPPAVQISSFALRNAACGRSS